MVQGRAAEFNTQSEREHSLCAHPGCVLLDYVLVHAGFYLGLSKKLFYNARSTCQPNPRITAFLEFRLSLPIYVRTYVPLSSSSHSAYTIPIYEWSLSVLSSCMSFPFLTFECLRKTCTRSTRRRRRRRPVFFFQNVISYKQSLYIYIERESYTYVFVCR